jgi:hypothetical protein
MELESTITRLFHSFLPKNYTSTKINQYLNFNQDLGFTESNMIIAKLIWPKMHLDLYFESPPKTPNTELLSPGDSPSHLPIYSAIGQTIIKNHLASDPSAEETLIQYRLGTKAAKKNFH